MSKLLLVLLVCGLAISGIKGAESKARKKARWDAIKEINSKDLRRENSIAMKFGKQARASKGDKEKVQELYTKQRELIKALDAKLMEASATYKAFVEQESAQ